MSEFEELDRLRDADPVKAKSIPSAEDPGPRALRERIMMSEPGTEPSTSRRTRMLVSAAAVVALIAAGGVVVATRGTDEPNPSPGEPINPPGQAMCVESYSLAALKNRAVAIDGTVVSVSGDDITFKVNEAFTGSADAEIVLKGASTLGGITSAGDPLPLDPGTRLLVAGDGGFAWSCGFTQVYSSSVAAQWREALS